MSDDLVDMERDGMVACMQCKEPIDVAENLKCIGLVNGELDLLIDCPECGATHNAFVRIADFVVVSS